MNRPQPNEYPAWGETYISKVKNDALEVLTNQITALPNLLLNSENKQNFTYKDGKWTVKELLGHIIDTERILTYRLMCFARNEQQPLAGFDENAYVTNAHFIDRDFKNLTEEFSALRKANFYLFESLNEAELDRKGVASGRDITVRALLHVIAGHVEHHIQILKERYDVV
ncbi:MAG: DinB family protein [Pedobacter sp.]|nr:DinB family protein [Pedobacter sp.]